MNKYCPVCGSSYIKPLIATGYLPVSIMDATSDPLKSMTSNMATSDYVRCENCTHIFNASFDPDLVDYDGVGCRMFNNGEGWKQHISDLQKYIDAQYFAKIIEIGPGDGSFINDLSCADKLVFEPSTDADKCVDLGIPTVLDYFDPDEHVAPTVVDHTLFLMRHVLEHIEDASTFIEGIIRNSGNNVIDFIVEVPNIVNALTNERIEDWVYEHVHHFTPVSLKRLFTLLGCNVTRIETKYNNEIIVLHARYVQDDATKFISAKCKGIAENYVNNKTKAQDTLFELVHQGKSIAYWGGIGKSALFLHQIALRPMRVVDSDHKKTGLCVPGLAVVIEHCTRLLSDPVDIIVISTSWRANDIVNEIKQRGIKCEKVLFYSQGTLTEVKVGK